MPTRSPDAPLTHAGGVVHRLRDGRREFLVVTASKRPDHWVLPKGHIEAGEAAETTAVREVREEAGIDAEVERALGDTALDIGSEHQRIRFYLMRAVGEVPRQEQRALSWLEAGAATQRLSFPEARELIRAAAQSLDA
jgi:8-oxo-dGTP pyrophosphatase MutT (NUDIX family)